MNAFLGILKGNLAGTETQKKVSGFLYSSELRVTFDGQDTIKISDLHHLGALTFNEKECSAIMEEILLSINPKQHYWKEIYKVLWLLEHLVLQGAERCVDHGWKLSPQIELLKTYNTVSYDRFLSIKGGGTDEGAPVRRIATRICAILENEESVRAAREKARGSAGFVIPPVIRPEEKTCLDLSGDLKGCTFGISAGKSVGAAYGLNDVPNFYEGRPERYFDKPSNSQQNSCPKRADEQEHAFNILGLDVEPIQTNPVSQLPSVGDRLVQQQLEAQLQEQQRQLEELKQIIALQALQKAQHQQIQLAAAHQLHSNASIIPAQEFTATYSSPTEQPQMNFSKKHLTYMNTNAPCPSFQQLGQTHAMSSLQYNTNNCNQRQALGADNTQQNQMFVCQAQHYPVSSQQNQLETQLGVSMYMQPSFPETNCCGYSHQNHQAQHSFQHPIATSRSSLPSRSSVVGSIHQDQPKNFNINKSINFPNLTKQL